MKKADFWDFLAEYREDNRIEAKQARGGLPHSLWETYSAFANTLGGVILLGVAEAEDKSLFAVPLPDPQALVDEFWELVSDPTVVSANILQPEDVQILRCEGVEIVVIFVPRADRHSRPVYIGVYAGEATDVLHIHLGVVLRLRCPSFNDGADGVQSVLVIVRAGKQVERGTPAFKDKDNRTLRLPSLALYQA